MPGPAVDRRLAIFDDVGADRRLLDHVGEVALVHFGHAAAGVARGEIAAEQLVLLLGRPRLARADLEVGVAAQQLALGGGGFELRGEDPDGDAGRAVDAARTVGDRLAAAEADAAQGLVELARVAAAELGEDLPLDLARQIRARARVRDEKFGKAEGCAHPRPHSNGYELFMRLVNAEGKGFGRDDLRRKNVPCPGERTTERGSSRAKRVRP